MIHPTNPSSPPTLRLPGAPSGSSQFIAVRDLQKHLALLLLSLFEALNKKSKRISRKEAEKKKPSKVGSGVFIVGVGVGLDLKGNSN